MNIIYLTFVDISQPTGPGTNELEFISTLHKISERKGDRLKLITNKLSNDLKRNVGEHYVLIDSPFMIRGFSRILLRVQYFLRFLKILKLIEKDKEKIDLFVCRYDSKWITPLLQKIHKKKIPAVIRHFHSDTKQLANNENTVLEILRNSVSIDTTWETKQVELESKGLENVSIIHNSVNTSVFNLRNRASSRDKLINGRFDFVVGYIGGFPLERGALEIIELAKRYKKPDLNIGFLCVGDSKRKNESHYSEILRLIEENDLKDNFIVEGYLPYEEMPQFFHSVDLGLALVPENIAKTYGNSSQKIFQYIASGAIPVVPEGTNQFLVSKGLAIEYKYKDGIVGLENTLDQVINKNNDSIIWNIEKRFEMIDRFHSKENEISKMLSEWLQKIKN